MKRCKNLSGIDTTQQCLSETEKKNILEDFFSSALPQLKKYHPPGNMKFIIIQAFSNA